MTKFYLKQPMEAEQFDGSDEMISKYSLGHFTDSQSPWINIATLNGENIFVGDWIATGVKGEHRPITDDVFQQTYAGLPVIPRAIADIITYAKDHKKVLAWAFRRTPNEFLEMGAISKSNFYEVAKFFRTHGSQDVFVRAWLDGYQVEGD